MLERKVGNGRHLPVFVLFAVLLFLTGTIVTLVSWSERSNEGRMVHNSMVPANRSIFWNMTRTEVNERLESFLGDIGENVGGFHIPGENTIYYETKSGQSNHITCFSYDGNVIGYEISIYKMYDQTSHSISDPKDILNRTIGLQRDLLNAFDVEMGDDITMEFGGEDFGNGELVVILRQTWNGLPLDGTGMRVHYDPVNTTLVQAIHFYDWLDMNGLEKEALNFNEAKDRIYGYLEAVNFTVKAPIRYSPAPNVYNSWTEVLKLPIWKDNISIDMYGAVHGRLSAYYYIKFVCPVNLTHEVEARSLSGRPSTIVYLNTTLVFTYRWAFDLENGRLLYWSDFGESSGTFWYLDANLFGDNIDWLDRQDI